MFIKIYQFIVLDMSEDNLKSGLVRRLHPMYRPIEILPCNNYVRFAAKFRLQTIHCRYKDIDSLVIGYIPEKQDIHFVFRNCGNNIRPQTANVVILRKTIFEMRYEQPVTPIAVFLQQIVRPLGMNDDRRKSFVSTRHCHPHFAQSLHGYRLCFSLRGKRYT